jgi:hypothetical protein
MSLERRSTPRVEVLGRLHGQVVSMDAPVTVREVSLGGLSFSSTVLFPIDAVHEFRLTLGDASAVVLRGRIVRITEKLADNGTRLYITGVQFIDEDPPDDAPSIGGLIDKIN